MCPSKDTAGNADVAAVDYDINFDDRTVVVTIDDTETPFNVWKASVHVGVDLADIPNSGGEFFVCLQILLLFAQVFSISPALNSTVGYLVSFQILVLRW